MTKEIKESSIEPAVKAFNESDSILGAIDAAFDKIEFVEDHVDRSWKPIETAPKGRDILVHYKNCFDKSRIVIARYIEKYTEESDNDYAEYSEEHDNYFTPEGWYEQIENWDEYSGLLITDAITHWMSLPTEPKIT